MIAPLDAQMILRRELLAHVERLRSGLDRAASSRNGDSDGAPDAELCVAVVVRDLDPASFAAGALEFAGRIPLELRDPWYRTFTKTIFYAGNPATVGERFPCEHVTAGGDIAWIGPVPRRSLEGLSRMLRLFRGPAPVPGPAVTAAVTEPSPRSATLLVATNGVSTEQYLVHVNHVVCEASLRRLIGPGDGLRIDHTGEIDASQAAASVNRTQLRIAPDERSPDDLRLYARLTGEPEPIGARDE